MHLTVKKSQNEVKKEKLDMMYFIPSFSGGEKLKDLAKV